MAIAQLTCTEKALLPNTWLKDQILKATHLDLFNAKFQKLAESLCPHILEKYGLECLKSLDLKVLFDDIDNAMKATDYPLVVEYTRLFPFKNVKLQYIQTIVQKYIETNQLPKAEKAAEELTTSFITESAYQSQDILIQITQAYINIGDLQSAERVINKLTIYEQSDQLEKLAQAYISRNNLQEAERIGNNIYRQWAQTVVLFSIIKAHLKNDHPIEAEKIAHNLKDEYDKDQIFKEIVQYYIAINNLKEAERTALGTQNYGFEALKTLAEFHIKSNNLQEAEKITNLMKYLPSKDDTTEKIIQKYIFNDELPEALRLIPSIDNKYKQATVLKQIIEVYISKNMPDKAQELAHTIHCQYTKSSAFQMLIQKHIDLKNIPKALSLLKFIDEKKFLIKSYLLIASKVDDREKFYELAKKAQEIAETEDDEKIRNELLYLIVEFYISTNHSMLAQGMASLMTDSFWKDRSFQEISTFETSQGFLLDAAKSANHIENEWSRSDTFLNILKANLNQSNIDQALKTISKITFKSSLVEALVELTLFYHNHYTDHPKETIFHDEARKIASEIPRNVYPYQQAETALKKLSEL